MLSANQLPSHLDSSPCPSKAGDSSYDHPEKFKLFRLTRTFVLFLGRAGAGLSGFGACAGGQAARGGPPLLWRLAGPQAHPGGRRGRGGGPGGH